VVITGENKWPTDINQPTESYRPIQFHFRCNSIWSYLITYLSQIHKTVSRQSTFSRLNITATLTHAFFSFSDKSVGVIETERQLCHAPKNLQWKRCFKDERSQYCRLIDNRPALGSNPIFAASRRT